MKEQFKKPDFIFLTVTAAILILGILILSSASALLSQSKFHDSYYLIKHQLLMGILPGLFLGFLAYKVPLGFIRKVAPFALLATVFFLILVVAKLFRKASTASA
jgi:cell division protein FtsW